MKFSTVSFVAGFTLGVLLAGAWFLGGNPEALISQDSFLTSTDTDKLLQKSGALSVADQSPGNVVFIESITVPPPGVWVAVREINGGELGNVLGAARVSGPRSSLEIQLLRETTPNNSYAVELYRDDNNGSFDPSTNSVYVDFDTGARVVEYFSTSN